MDPYKLLGVSPNSTSKEVTDAYKNIIENYLNEGTDENSRSLYNEKLSELNEAYRLISQNITFEEVRELIGVDDFLSAEAKLNLVSDDSSPEWNYLTGVLLIKKGWIHSGVNHLKKAAKLNPYNTEYKNTLSTLNQKINFIKTNYSNNGNKGTSPLNLCGNNATTTTTIGNNKKGLC
ncbi:MAG: ABC transporter substrate-binding protein [Clostridium sp.]